MKDCAVGGVNTLRIDVAEGVEQAFVEVRWSVVNRPERTVLSLRRNEGELASPERGLATCRCPKCSAPLDDNGQATCAYCGDALTSAPTDWVLDAMLTWEAFCAGARPTDPNSSKPSGTRAPPPREALRLFHAVAAFATVDGQVTEAERVHLVALAARWKLPAAELEQALQGPFEVPQFSSGSPEAQVFLSSLVDLTYADGHDASELMALTRVSMVLGLAPKLLALLEAKRR